jgi:hypothetical protein
MHLVGKRTEELCVVTAADESHFQSSLNLLRSLQFFEPKTKVIYYDLGLTSDQSHFIQNNFPSIVLKQFPYDDFPDFFNVKINAGEYAWKAACINLAMLDSTTGVLWLDAGNIITGDLRRIQKMIRQNGIFIMQASNTIQQFTHPKTLEYFNCTERLHLPQFSAAAIGFSSLSKEAARVLEKWLFCSKDKAIIAPKGSSRVNHRQDQAILTLIILENYKMNARIRKQIASNNDLSFYNFLIHQDVEAR